MRSTLRCFTLIIAALLFAAPLSAAAGTCPTLTRTLGRNSEGADVRDLQQFLAERGLLDRIYILGVYGLKTERAVKAFQLEQGIVTSGTPATTGYGAVGARTRARIAAVCLSNPTLGATQTQQQSVQQPQSVNIVIPTNSYVNTMPVQTNSGTYQTPTAPRIELGSITTDTVMVRFFGIPAQSLIYMIDPATGKRVESGGFSPLNLGGNGFIAYPMLGEFAGNSYAFAAVSSSTRQGIATSSVFTVPKPAANATGSSEVGTLQVLDGEVLLYTFAGITRGNADTRCKTEKTNNPARNTKCTFNGYTMFVQ